MMPEFKNKPNERIQIRHTTALGTQNIDYFMSRSVAVVGVVIAITPEGQRVLVTKRSNRMRDEKGKLGVPCGYCDWSESAHSAMVREVYEETSLYLGDYQKFTIFDNHKKPFDIIDEHDKDARQNVSLIYLTVLEFDDMKYFPDNIEKYTCHETADVKWMKVLDFYSYHKNLPWAFHHDETIKSAYTFFNKNFIR